MGLLVGVHAPGRHQRGRVVHARDDGLGDFLGAVGDDLAANGTAAAADDAVGHGAGHEAVENAQYDRLHLIAIDEVAASGHHGVNQEDDPEEPHLRVLLVHHRRHEVHAAAVRAAARQHGIARAVDDAGHQRAEDLAGAVGRLIGEAGQIHALKENQRQRKRQHVHHAARRHGSAYLHHRPDGQRDVDEQAHVAHADVEQILNHRADAVQARRRKPIGKHEQLIVQRARQRQADDDQIGQQLLLHWFFPHPDCFCQIIPQYPQLFAGFHSLLIIIAPRLCVKLRV